MERGFFFLWARNKAGGHTKSNQLGSRPFVVGKFARIESMKDIVLVFNAWVITMVKKERGKEKGGCNCEALFSFFFCWG